MNTYSTLKDSIAAWLAQSNISANDTIVDDFIDIAEAEAYSRLRVRQMEATTTLSTVANQSYVALPTGFLGFRGVYRDGSPQCEMTYYTPEQLNSVANTSRAPYAFTIVGDNMVFAGPADSIYEVEVTYYARPTALSGSNTSNWLTTTYPHTLLWGALKAASIYIDDDVKAAKFGTLFAKALDDIEIADQNDKYGPAPRMKSEVVQW